jgi:hypothetical protein
MGAVGRLGRRGRDSWERPWRLCLLWKDFELARLEVVSGVRLDVVGMKERGR